MSEAETDNAGLTAEQLAAAKVCAMSPREYLDWSAKHCADEAQRNRRAESLKAAALARMGGGS